SGTLYRPDPEVTLARSVRARKPIQEADVRTTPQYLKGDPLPVTAVDIAGIRTLMVVPMLKDNEPIGGIAIYRKEVRPFGEKQIELVTNLPPRPSSPSRTPACSTSCPSPCSSRPPPRTS